MKNKCSRFPLGALFLPMARVLPFFWLSACGGFVTPPQNVSVGVALSAEDGLPPKLSKDSHELTLTRLRLSGTVEVDAMPFATLADADVPLSTAWVSLAEGPLARGTYQDVKLDLTGLSLDGTYDGRDFHLVAQRTRNRLLPLATAWRVELGKMSSLSLVTEPKRWMTGNEGPGNDGLIDPFSSKAAEGLMDRFVDSLAAHRDDDHDGHEDPSP